VAILGPNVRQVHAMNTLSGLVRARSERSDSESSASDGLRRIGSCEWGSPRTRAPQAFPHLTVRQNLLLGVLQPAARARPYETLADGRDSFPAFAERYTQNRGALSGGEQQMVPP